MSRETIERKITFDKDNVDWFVAQYPKASLSGICDMLLEKFRSVSEFTPSHYAEVAAKSLKTELETRQKPEIE